jgi:small-conductance mechanosensitive channel
MINPTAIHFVRQTGGTSSQVLTEKLTSGDWIRAGAIVTGAIVIAIVAHRIARTTLGKALGSGFAAIIAARLLAYLLFMVGLIYALSSLGVRVGPLLGALGLGGLVLALALQKVVENFVGSIILQTRRPFTVGDTVDLDGHVGTVIDIDARTTVLRGLDASMIRIPNGEVLTTTIVNLTRESLRRSQIQVGVAYDTDLERATEVLIEATGRVQRVERYPAPLIVLTQFGSSSIDYTIYFWHASDVPSELKATHDLVLAVHHALADAGITIAFPQMVVWSGHEADSNPYRSEPGEIFTEHPDREPPTPVKSDGSHRRWRIPRRTG